MLQKKLEDTGSTEVGKDVGEKAYRMEEELQRYVSPLFQKEEVG